MLDEGSNPAMASLWNRIQFLYLGRKAIARWAIPLFVLTIVIILLRWATAPMGTVTYRDDEVFMFRHIDEMDIEVHLDSLPDSRSPSCLSHSYPNINKEKVSIILDFHEHQFYDLRLTLESLLRFTPDNLYEEIVLLDDGSGDASVQKHAGEYLSQQKFHKIKAFRSDSSDGPAMSRFKASKIATGSVLIFLTSDVVVTEGWLQPLVHHVQNNRKSLVVPHADSILSGFKHFKTPANLVSVFNMALDTMFYESKKEDEILDTPVMTGSAFAVEKRYLDSIGSFDDGLGQGGGENLELSFRAWMCGGSVQINTCSRVAVTNALKARPIDSAVNYQRIAELWMGDLKRFSYNQKGHLFDPNDSARQALKTRQQYLHKVVQCSSFKEYLERVAPMVVMPPSGARYFGQIRSKTGYCVLREFLNHGRMRMDHCKPHIYNPDTFFEYDNMGRISRSGKCVEMTPDDEIRFRACNDKLADQMWEYDKEGLIESTPKKGMCLSHYYDQVGEYSYLKAVKCVPDERSMRWSFVKH